jgi:hypothetical protein
MVLVVTVILYKKGSYKLNADHLRAKEYSPSLREGVRGRG